MGNSCSAELKAIEAATNKIDLSNRNALIFGGTSGIGREISKKLASRGASVTIVGRSETAGNELVSEFKKMSPDSTSFSFIKADLSLLRDCKRVADLYLAKEKRLDYLVFSQGFFTMSSDRMITKSEGLEYKLVLNYYGRVYLTKLLLPLLKQTASSPLNADCRVLSIFSGGVHSSYSLYKEDPRLEEKNGNWGLSNAANMAGMFNDFIWDEFSARFKKEKQQPSSSYSDTAATATENNNNNNNNKNSGDIAFVHVAPGIVATNLGRESGFFGKTLLSAATAIAGKSAAECATWMTNCLLNPEYKGGFRLLDQYAKPAKKTDLHTQEAREFVWKDTMQLLDSVEAKFSSSSSSASSN